MCARHAMAAMRLWIPAVLIAVVTCAGCKRDPLWPAEPIAINEPSTESGSIQFTRGAVGCAPVTIAAERESTQLDALFS